MNAAKAQQARGSAAGFVIEAGRSDRRIDLRELWQHRELVLQLARRDVQIRYKQSLLGAGWAIAQPLFTMFVFSVLFGALLGRDRMPSPAGVPYAVSTLCALVPWQLFATSLTTAGNSLVANQALITKVYFPRLAAPIAPVLAALVDFALALAALLVLMLVHGVRPGWGFLALPLLAGAATVTALAVSLWLSALNAVYRDVRHVLPFLVQTWLFVTPVVYTSASVLDGRPAWVATLYGVNPMVGVVEGFRWALLGAPCPPAGLFAASAAVVAVLLIGGARYFRRMERSFADLV